MHVRSILSTVLFLYAINSYALFVDFETGMKPNCAADDCFKDNNANWQLGKRLYADFIASTNLEGELKIPHIFHHIWLGSRMPEVCVGMRESWFTHNPGWKGILWTDRQENYIFGEVATSVEQIQEMLQDKNIKSIVCDVKNFPLLNYRAYASTDNYGERSDIVRYEVLYEFGGLYIDTDFRCLKSFDVLHALCDFYAGIGYSKTYGLLNGLIGSSAANPIIKMCIEDLVGKSNPHDTSSIIGRTGPGLLTRSFFKAIRSGYSGVAIGFPPTIFYPWPNWNRKDNDPDNVQSWIRPESYAVHYWHVSWQKKTIAHLRQCYPNQKSCDE